MRLCPALVIRFPDISSITWFKKDFSDGGGGGVDISIETFLEKELLLQLF